MFGEVEQHEYVPNTVYLGSAENCVNFDADTCRCDEPDSWGESCIYCFCSDEKLKRMENPRLTVKRIIVRLLAPGDTLKDLPDDAVYLISLWEFETNHDSFAAGEHANLSPTTQFSLARAELLDGDYREVLKRVGPLPLLDAPYSFSGPRSQPSYCLALRTLWELNRNPATTPAAPQKHNLHVASRRAKSWE